MSTTSAIRDSIEAILQLARERKWSESLERAEALLASCDAKHRPAAEACHAVVTWRASVAGGGALEDGLPEAIAGIARLEEVGCEASLGWLFDFIGYAVGLLGDFETGLALIERSVEDALQRDDRRQVIQARSHHASLLMFTEDNDRALISLQQALDHCGDEDDVIRAGLANNIAYCRILSARRCAREDPKRAELARQALDDADEALSNSATPPNWRGTLLDTRGAALGMLGRYSEAEAAFVEGLRQPAVSGRTRVNLMINYAKVLIAGGKYTPAADLLVRAEAEVVDDLVDDVRERILALQIEIARHFSRHDEVDALWARRYRQIVDRHSERLRNVRRYTELQAELKHAQAAVRDSRRREREALLRDLHDGFASQLLSARLAARRGALSGAEVVDLLDECISDLYLIVDTLASVEGNLGVALRFLRNRLQSRLADRSIELHWKIELVAAPALGHQRLVQALRVVQEAITNVLKHAQAANLWVDARLRGSDALVITVRDDGVGLPAAFTEGQGVASMRSRAAGLGGTLTLRSDGAGTLVELEFPVAA